MSDAERVMLGFAGPRGVRVVFRDGSDLRVSEGWPICVRQQDVSEIVGSVIDQRGRYQTQTMEPAR